MTAMEKSKTGKGKWRRRWCFWHMNWPRIEPVLHISRRRAFQPEKSNSEDPGARAGWWVWRLTKRPRGMGVNWLVRDEVREVMGRSWTWSNGERIFQVKSHLDKVQGMTRNTKLIMDFSKGNRPNSGHVKSLTQIKNYLGESGFPLLIARAPAGCSLLNVSCHPVSSRRLASLTLWAK